VLLWVCTADRLVCIVQNRKSLKTEGGASDVSAGGWLLSIVCLDLAAVDLDWEI
jgi:hypothetical protein